MSAGGKYRSTISAEFYARQRVDVACVHCDETAIGLHPDEAAAWFAEHRQKKHPDLPPAKKRRHAPSYSTPSAYEYQRRFQTDEELAWREGRRHIYTVGRTDA